VVLRVTTSGSGSHGKILLGYSRWFKKGFFIMELEQFQCRQCSASKRHNPASVPMGLQRMFLIMEKSEPFVRNNGKT